jgi:hypothetical protein
LATAASVPPQNKRFGGCAVKLTTFIKRSVKAVVPYGVVALYRRNKIKQETIKSYGNNPKSYCPVCRKTSYFKPYGYTLRPKACCPCCGSVERHRVLWLFFKKKVKLFEQTKNKILHIAAEPCFENWFKKYSGKII